MKRFYSALFLALSMFVANAQSFDREFHSFADSTTFANNGTSVDFLRAMPDTGFLIISCLSKGDPFSFLQLWFPNLNITLNPYIMTCVSSTTPVSLKITGTYVSGGGSCAFPDYALKGGSEFDTAFFKGSVTKSFEQLMLNVSAPPAVLTFDWFRMGEMAHPIQTSINLAPKVKPSAACTIKVANVSYYYEKVDPISKLMCTATCTNSHISGISVVESPSDTSFLITFNTDAATKNTVAFMTVTIKDLGSNYTRKYDLAVTITPAAGTDEPANSELKVYPVPVKDVLTVELPDDGGYQISVVDAAGKIVLGQVVMKGISKAELNTSALASGAYSLIIANQSGLMSKKFNK